MPRLIAAVLQGNGFETGCFDVPYMGVTAMWRNELFVEFRKGEHFMNAIEKAGAPADCFDEASDLWGEWCAREYLESEEAEAFSRHQTLH